MPVDGPPLAEPVALTDLLRRGLEAEPDSQAVVSPGLRWTWRELDELTDRLATGFFDLGLTPGDRVASLMPNCCALLAHYIACVKAGLVATPLNYRYHAPQIDHALEVSGAKLLVAASERHADVAASRLATDLPMGVVWHHGDDAKDDGWQALLAAEPDAQALHAIDADAPAFIFFTSGSTGPAKGVTHSHRTLGWIAASTIEGLKISAADVFLASSSLSHEGGVGFSLSALAAGVRVVVGRHIDPHGLLPLLRDQRPTVVWMLPAALFALVRDHDAHRDEFTSVRLFMAGGDKVSAEMEREFLELTGYPIHETYGMTEFGGATANPPDGVNKPGSIGCLCPGYSLMVRDERGGELPSGVEGQLWIASPSLMLGYWNDPTATAATIKNGWLDTGDMVTVDEDGYLWFQGRRKQIIVHDGSNICPQEVEDSLLDHPAVAAAGVVGVHDLLHGENVRAYVALAAGAERPTAAELIRFSHDRIGYRAPEEIVFVDEMPLTPVGKIDRTALKRMAESSC